MHFLYLFQYHSKPVYSFLCLSPWCLNIQSSSIQFIADTNTVIDHLIHITLRKGGLHYFTNYSQRSFAQKNSQMIQKAFLSSLGFPRCVPTCVSLLHLSVSSSTAYAFHLFTDISCFLLSFPSSSSSPSVPKHTRGNHSQSFMSLLC